MTTKKTHKLCVLMPSYNKGSYITQAIDSVLAQETNFDFQLIVTDDASTDETLDIVKDFQSKHPNKIIWLPSKNNQGLLSNIIKAYKEMKCEYFCVLDPDDYYTDTHFLQKGVDFLDKNKEFSIYASGVMIMLANNTQYKRENIKDNFIDSNFEDMLQDKAVLGHTTGSVFRNNYFNDKIIQFLESKCANGYTYKEVAYREDDFRNRVHLTTGKAHFVNEIVGIYRYVETGLYLSSNQLRQTLLAVRAYLDMYDYFGRKDMEWIDLAIDRLCNWGGISMDMMKDYNNIDDILELNQILYRISQINLNGFEKIIRTILCKIYTKNEEKEEKIKKLSLKYKIFYKIYKYLDRKIKRKLGINMEQL